MAKRYDVIRERAGDGTLYGEAHSNAYIDTCMVCAPRWGFCGAKEPIT